MSDTAVAPQLVPKSLLRAACALVIFSIAIAAFGRWSGIGTVRGEHTVPVQTANYRFLDRADGGITVIAPESGRIVSEVAPGTDGFVRVALRSLAFDRKKFGVGAEPVFAISQWPNGRWTLDDPSTGKRVELAAFGRDNMQLFASFAAKRGSL